MFVHLHNHSHYSILEGLPKPKDYVAKALEMWMQAIAITDTSNVHWCHELYKEAIWAGIKPILGTEIYVESSIDTNINHKLVLLAKSLNWYQNIISLTTKASLENAWKKPKICFQDIIDLKEKVWDLEIVCLSWPISWEIPFFILSWKDDSQILSRIKEYQDIFGIDNYYLELMYHDDIPKQINYR
jgi:DNA polymerase-3 subunit alpha